LEFLYDDCKFGGVILKKQELFMNHSKKGRDDTASIVAEIHGVSPSYVRMITNGKRENAEILSTYMEIKQRKRQLIAEIRSEKSRKEHYAN